MYSSWASSTADAGIDVDKHPVKREALSPNRRMSKAKKVSYLFAKLVEAQLKGLSRPRLY